MRRNKNFKFSEVEFFKWEEQKKLNVLLTEITLIVT